MQLPKYEPNQWVIFTSGGGATFGKIITGTYYDEKAGAAVKGWQYSIDTGPNVKHGYVSEKNIIATFDGGWCEVGNDESENEPRSN